MTTLKCILALFTTITCMNAAATSPDQTGTDTCISVFWNKRLVIRLQVFRPDETDFNMNNAVMTLYTESPEGRKTIYRDSLFVASVEFITTDVDGDGIKDLLIYNRNEGTNNKSYHLYLVDQRPTRLTRVKKFEKILNPVFDPSQCLLTGYESYERKLLLNRYRVNKNGSFSVVGW